MDNGNNVVQKVALSNYFIVGGTFTASVATTGGNYDQVPLNGPRGIAGDKNYFYVSDSNHIWKYSKSDDTVSVFAGTTTQGYSGDGSLAVNAQLKNPNSLWMTSSGILYVADTDNYVIRRIETNGIINLVAGSGVWGNSGNGQSATSTSVTFQNPNSVYVDSTGQVYILDNKARIRTVTGGIINAFAGDGNTSPFDESVQKTAAVLSAAYDLKGDSTGNIYYVEYAFSRIRVIGTNGLVTTFVTGTTQPFSLWIDTVNNVQYTGALGQVQMVVDASDPPSLSPTVRPTQRPSVQPTSRPTGPTRVPTVQPTKNPTYQPTSQPTTEPTAQPTRQPIGQPTGQPTGQPAGMPTAQPTMQPVGRPSSKPSNLPSSQPTVIPSSQPTVDPSGQPSSVPSIYPSSAPTDQPSSIPSAQPSTAPSNRPSSIPSTRPSSVPSRQPTSIPSSQPFSFPTGQPTSIPSSHPSSFPSAQPTGSPSAPSFSPTFVPTFSPSVQTSDIIKISGTVRVKFVNGQSLNDVSVSTTILAIRNISGNPQSTSVTSKVLVNLGGSVRRALSVISSSSTYDISFVNSYLMSFHNGFTSTELATAKTAMIKQAIEGGEFEIKLRDLARSTQLLNGTCREVYSLNTAILPPPSKDDDDDSLSAGSIVGIVVGVIGGCFLLGLGLYCFRQKRRGAVIVAVSES